MNSPTQNSLKFLRDAGYRVAVVERWNAQAHKRQDLFGFVDLLAIGHGETLAVQTTSLSNISKRANKILDDEHRPALLDLLASGWKVHVHGWHKEGRLWKVRIDSLNDRFVADVAHGDKMFDCRMI